jgi:hypothetical protein
MTDVFPLLASKQISDAGSTVAESQISTSFDFFIHPEDFSKTAIISLQPWKPLEALISLQTRKIISEYK